MYDVLLAFGDSITQYGNDPSTSGWLTHLSRFYERRLDVLNRGFSGYTTSDARLIVESILPTSTGRPDAHRALDKPKWPPQDDTFPGKEPAVRLLVLFFGANDAVFSEFPNHVPLAKFRENLRYFVSLIHDPDSDHYAPDTRILFVTPPTVGDKMYEDLAKRYGQKVKRKNEVTKMYAEAVKAVAQESGLPCVDLWSAIETRVKKMDDKSPLAYEGYDTYLIDGVHLNGNGNELLAKLAMNAIVNTWPELDPA
ncbi:SGNH hydrolase [Martensiomyces pterosporus]|nr:SGNH hydrolase [Martensiomyces pterosporus]